MSKCGNSDETKFFVQPSEICALKALKLMETNNYGTLYDSNFIFNTEFKNKDTTLNNLYRDSSNNYIYKYDGSKKDLCYSLDTDNNIWNINCAILYNNPFLTYDELTNKCVTIPNFRFQDKFSVTNNGNSNVIKINNLDKIPNSLYKNQKYYCENKWYDWITIPNFHFGNQYERDAGDYDSQDVRKCYKPCKKGYMPYKVDAKEYICIPKFEADDGMYSKKMDFSPIALINMIGNTKTSLKKLYNRLFEQEFKINYDSSITTKNPNVNYDSNALINEGWNQIRSCIRENIIDNTSMTSRYLETNPNVISYLNPNFNETDETLVTLRGMSTYDLVNDAILLHTYELAFNYDKFIKSLTNHTTYTDNSTKALSSIFKQEKIVEIKTHIYNVKNISDLGDLSLSKIQRIANILYKAINICFDGKSAFSIKLIELTTTAFNNHNKIGFDFTDVNLINIPFIIDKKSQIFDILSKNFTEPKHMKIIIDNFNDINNPMAILYSTENIEKSNNCSGEGQLLDSRTNKCVACDTYCNIETCNTDTNCSIFCETTCDNLKKTETKSCGVTKKADNYNRKKDIRKIETPVDEQINLPSFSTIIRTTVKLLLALIFIYLCYVLFQMYGETIITVFNMIELLIRWLFIKIIYIISGLAKGKGFTNSNLDADTAYMEYIRNNAVSKFERVTNKIKFTEKTNS